MVFLVVGMLPVGLIMGFVIKALDAVSPVTVGMLPVCVGIQIMGLGVYLYRKRVK